MTKLKVRDVLQKAKLSFNKKKADKAQKIIERRLEELHEAEKVVKRIKAEIEEIAEMDLADIDTLEMKYNE